MLNRPVNDLTGVQFMPADARDVLCRYHYDPLDRLVGTTPTEDDGLQRFYCKSRLATEIQGPVQRSIFQQGEQLLAQQDQQGDLAETSLLATDQMRSVLQVLKANRPSPIAYSPYGNRPIKNGLLSLLKFNGERSDPFTGHYLLGNGYRAFNPVLMRFNSPDNISPFGYGGLNPYAYCLGDPVNRYDDSGHVSWMGGLASGLAELNKRVVSSLSSLSKSKSKSPKLYGLVQDIFTVPPKDIAGYSEFGNIKVGRSLLPEKLITSPSDLKSIPSPSEMVSRGRNAGVDVRYRSPPVNFIFNDRKQLYVGSIGHEWLSGLTASPKVISAGEITRLGTNNFSIKNSSGHFIPGFKSLESVKKYLEKLGANVEMIRHGNFPD